MAMMTCNEAEKICHILKGIFIIDFEASGLHNDSYPTEIAWINPIRDEKATSYLIQPSQSWLETFWDPKAEAVTGISRTMIIHDSRPIQDIAQITIETIKNATLLLSDAPTRDAHWMRVLLEAARVEYKLPHFMEFQEFMWRYFNKGVLFKGKRKHRAGQDVERMAAAFKIAAMDYIYYSSLNNEIIHESLNLSKYFIRDTHGE